VVGDEEDEGEGHLQGYASQDGFTFNFHILFVLHTYVTLGHFLFSFSFLFSFPEDYFSACYNV